jgi:hypothetical protein
MPAWSRESRERGALTWDPEPAEIPARACNCSFCIKHGDVSYVTSSAVT